MTSKIVCKDLRRSANGQMCMIGTSVCNHDPSTTVLAHIGGKGKSLNEKNPDVLASFACSDCHDEVDGRTWRSIHSQQEIELKFLRGHIRTMLWWIEHGFMEVSK